MSTPHLVHLVCTDAFAGVERYTLSAARHQALAGFKVTVIGGDESRMRLPLEDAHAEWLPGSGIVTATRSLRLLSKGPTSRILITHMTAADVLGAWWSRRAKGPVVSVRHFAAHRGSRPLIRVFMGAVARRITLEIAVSHFVAEHIERPARVVHTGVPSVAAQEATAPRDHIVLALQRLEPEKDTGTVIRGWQLTTRPEQWRLVIAGDGSQRKELELLAAGDPSITFVGATDEVAALMARAAIFVAPTPREGLGLAVLEAMSHGMAVIAADGGGHRETVGALPTAALFPPHNAEALAQRIGPMLANPDLRERYGAALAAHQRVAFDRDRQFAKFTAAVLAGTGAHHD